MALTNKRIIDLPERATLNDDDYVAVDGDTGGTAKYNLSDIVDNVTDNSTELTGIRTGADGKTYQSAGDAVRGQISDLKDSVGGQITDLKEDLRKTKNLESALNGTFENGGLDNDGVPYSSGYQFRIRNNEFIQSDSTKTVTIADGFRIRVDYYTDDIVSSGVYAGNSGWQTGSYTFEATNPFYKVVVARVAENSSEIANIPEFMGAVKSSLVKTVMDSKTNTEQNTDLIDLILKITPIENDGYIGTNGAISSPSSTTAEKYTDKIPVANGDIIDFSIEWTDTTSSKWVAVAYYAVDGTFINRAVLTNLNVRSFKTALTIANGVSFVSFTYRTYNSHNVTIVRKNSVNDIIDGIQKKIIAFNSGFVKSVNHRGYNSVAPENTLPAYKLSKLKGFTIVETDVSYTSDNVPVLLHDNTINRTARNADGTTISETINISDITYEQALTYDFGIWKGSDYVGTKIPTFEEFIILCRNIGLCAYVELKNTGGGHEALDQERTEYLVDIVNKYGMEGKVTWIADTIRLLGYVKNYSPKARLGYVISNISATSIANVQSLKTSDNDVFIDSHTYTASEIEACKNANIPLEIWTVNDANIIANINVYVSGITSDSLIAGQMLYQKYIS